MKTQNYAATLKIESVQKQTKTDSQIIITIYNSHVGGYVFGINCKLKRFIRSYYPQPADAPFATKKEAQRAAIKKINSWITDSRALKKAFYQFELSDCDQLELFDF